MLTLSLGDLAASLPVQEGEWTPRRRPRETYDGCGGADSATDLLQKVDLGQRLSLYGTHDENAFEGIDCWDQVSPIQPVHPPPGTQVPGARCRVFGLRLGGAYLSTFEIWKTIAYLLRAEAMSRHVGARRGHEGELLAILPIPDNRRSAAGQMSSAGMSPISSALRPVSPLYATHSTRRMPFCPHGSGGRHPRRG